MIDACKCGDLGKIKRLIEKCGADIYTKDDRVLENEHLSVMQYLIEHGVDIHAQDDEALRWSAISH